MNEKATVDDTVSVEAWERFCERLRSTGARLLASDLPESTDRREGVRHLTRLAAYALQWHVEHRDPDRPRFYRFNDHLTRWGGPNADNTYLRAHITAGRAYHITGRLGGCGELIVSTHEGDMQMGKPRVFAELSRDRIDVDGEGRIDVYLGGAARQRNWLPLDAGVEHVLVREYFTGDASEEPGEFHIRCLDGDGAGLATAARDLGVREIDTALAEAAEWIDASLVYWMEYIERIAAYVPANTLTPPRCPPGGAADILYGGGPYRVAQGEALLIEFEAPRARYWSIQLYSRCWFESLDFDTGPVALNHRQAHVDEDGRVRVVVCEGDPGTPNWLDVQGHDDGLVSYRWVWSSDAPEPTCRLVPSQDLRKVLPSGHPVIDRSARVGEIEHRRGHFSRRFRR